MRPEDLLARLEAGHEYDPMYGQLCNERDQLKAENAKLRELVKRMHDHIKESCDICDEDYCSSWDEDNECCVYDTMLREVLGVVRP